MRVTATSGRDEQGEELGSPTGLCARAVRCERQALRWNKSEPSPVRAAFAPFVRASPLDDEGIATVCELDLTSLSVENIIELRPHGREVYDIVELP